MEKATMDIDILRLHYGTKKCTVLKQPAAQEADLPGKMAFDLRSEGRNCGWEKTAPSCGEQHMMGGLERLVVPESRAK